MDEADLKSGGPVIRTQLQRLQQKSKCLTIVLVTAPLQKPGVIIGGEIVGVDSEFGFKLLKRLLTFAGLQQCRAPAGMRSGELWIDLKGALEFRCGLLLVRGLSQCGAQDQMGFGGISVG